MPVDIAGQLFAERNDVRIDTRPMMAIWIRNQKYGMKFGHLGVLTLKKFLILDTLAWFYDHILMNYFVV